ncbi:MAG: hypothetical protein JWM03_1697 [Rhodocyclales bacterium]|nr:hypothetical protein [Rhodocyclales bacterium]
MHSSDSRGFGNRLVRHSALCCGVLLAACSWADTQSTAAVRMPYACAVVEGKPTPENISTARALQSRIETSPLYAIPAAAPGASCRIHYQADGVVLLEYQFAHEASLHVKRDQAIEYTEQEARFNPGTQTPIAILQGAETAVFGEKGCGIEWGKPENKSSEAGGTETIFRGDVCNCQARFHRETGGMVGFRMTSAC